MVLGIVGKIGSGKSTVIEYIKKNYDTIVFSCDEIAKDIMEKGETDYDPGYAGEIFINEKKQEECRTLLHPLVFKRIYENIRKIKNENNFKNFSNINNQSENDIGGFLKKNSNLELNRINLNNENKNNSKLSGKIQYQSIEESNDINLNYVNKENNMNFLNINNFKNEKNFPEKLIIIESALPSDEMYKMCDKVIYIDSPYEDRVKRLKESRDYPESKTKLIYDSQGYYEKYYNKADYKIYNNGTKEELEEKVKEVLDEIYITCK